MESGYAGGVIESPTYGQVSTGTTGHAEVVRVRFDETVLPADTVLDIYFLIHDPTTLNRQGNDIGPQYRSIMLYRSKEQEELFQAAKLRAQNNNWNGPLVTEVVPLDTFYKAEEEHQDYFNKNPESGYCQIVINPKVIKARKEYAEWFKEEM